MRLRLALVGTAVLGLVASMAFALPRQGTAAGATAVTATGAARATASTQALLRGIHKIRHVIVIMQENRSFDSYFGTYPGTQTPVGMPAAPGPKNHTCIKPHVDHADSNSGGPHQNSNSIADVNGGKMNGFVGQAELSCKTATCRTDVMGYHVASDIPNYWAYAKNFVLDDHMFESDDSWSLPAHMYLTSGWSATCSNPANPMSCVGTDSPRNRSLAHPRPFAWTDLTWLLHKHGVSWGYYLDGGAQQPGKPAGVPSIWNPLPGFTDVKRDRQESNVQPLTNFISQAKAGTLPAVSWIVPKPADSEHPAALVSRGQAYVTRIINAVMRSRDWASTAIFLAWDDWGGFYDHQALSFDAYLRFIEDDFLASARLNPKTDGRPDPRPDVRENLTGNILKDFNFSQKPRSPLILNPCPFTTLVPKPVNGCGGSAALNFRSWGDS